MKPDRLYLDHAATTPVLPAVQAAMADALLRWANPSSPHGEGRAARAALEDARKRIGRALGWDGEILFTSGASEAIALALQGFDAVASAVEHDAVLSAVGEEVRIAVDAEGIVRIGSIAKGRRYAIQQVNNETGVIQPLEELGPIVREGGGLLVADCSQAAGKLPLPDADIIILSAHKLGGPPGLGALLMRDLGLLKPTGGQEKGYRRGTENLPAIVGLAAALEAGFDWLENAKRLRAELDLAIEAAGGEVVAKIAPRLATIGSYRMPDVSASSQLISFDLAGIAVSAGSACSSGTLKASHVLTAMGWDAQAAGEVVRVSFGPQTSESDIGRFVAAWKAMRERVQAA
ncbi:MAG: aminotransferase class V-fold PLP-dependent enzyme [Sphingomonadales bacterium]|jgi:cysteine desulfurase|nr:aminotransferase class V-fold PLP-dependent enzyme [Sphingomonadales bacterium]MBK9269041.1 aminotransferase class V-fold PLP-dependent enzyme [Sphingomonadales bacterium]MBP6435586.1 aminotransferase class V-fold PLP-dependent enzyme [Sphingorhabdus sp.]